MVPHVEARPTARLTTPLYLHQAQECCGFRLQLLSGPPGAAPDSMRQAALEDVTPSSAADHVRPRVSGVLASWWGGGDREETGRRRGSQADRQANAGSVPTSREDGVGEIIDYWKLRPRPAV
ncbi:hypothetical protein NDU88_003809 [Pleurodeles waltl]|uniref:Uncharacterized protein n=1 Tax=Pleurodeles waltl TaxID=8319 RepID=A0AAV7LT05_PLEWA|nr:hypothetical protein NDU88_003809 [Pleurodeles waltl]